MHYNYRNKFLVVIDCDVYVYKYEKCNFDQPFLSFQAKKVFIGQPKVCEMTQFSEAEVKEEFFGYTFLLRCENNENVYVSGLENFKFKTDHKIIDYVSLMGNNMIPYTFAVGEKYTNFLSSHYKFIQNEKIEDGTLLNASINSLDPYDYHVEKSGEEVFKKLEHTQIHTCWPGFGEHEENEDDEENENLIETSFNNGDNELVKIFNQKCVICLERDGDYASRQCGHRCIREQVIKIKLILIY